MCCPTTKLVSKTFFLLLFFSLLFLGQSLARVVLWSTRCHYNTTASEIKLVVCISQNILIFQNEKKTKFVCNNLTHQLCKDTVWVKPYALRLWELDQSLLLYWPMCSGVLRVGCVPYLNTFWSTAVSGNTVPEWVEFVVVWLPTSNGFLNCIFYFWINRNFRRKFHLVLHRLALAVCPKLASSLGISISTTPFESGFLDNNNSVHERSSSVSSTCTLVSLA